MLPIYLFGDVKVLCAERRLVVSGREVSVGARAFDLLVALIERRDRVVGKEELLTVVWPGLVVEEANIQVQVSTLRKLIGAQALVTVAGRGYRFSGLLLEAATDASAVPRTADGQAEGSDLPHPCAATRPKVHLDALIASRSVLAVIPFAVAEGVERRTLGDEVADGITNHLAARMGMRGIGRAVTSAFGPAPSLARLAVELKATHVANGRVTPSSIAGRVTIEAQVLDIARGDVIWTKQFADLDANKPEMFQEIGQHLANGLRNRFRKDDAASDVSNETDPVELTLGGWRDLDCRKSMDDVYRARGRFRSALRHDSESVIALNGLAATYQYERADPARQLTSEQIATHRDIVDRARRLAPDDSTALLLWGHLQIMEGRPDLALPALEKASRLVPSYPMGHVLIAQSLLLLGRLDEVQDRADRAIARSTGDPRRESSAYAIAAEAALMLGQEERARGLARHAVAVFPDNLYAHAALAAIEALAGRQDLAAIELAALLRLWPNATIAHFDDLRRSGNPAYVERRARLYEGLRLAGLPTGS